MDVKMFAILKFHHVAYANLSNLCKFMKHNKAFPASKANFVLTSEALAIYAFNLKKYSFFHI